MKSLISIHHYFRKLKLHQNSLRCISIAAHYRSNKSYYYQNRTIPLTCMTISEALDKAADEHGDHVSYISNHQGISKTYWELRKEAAKLASGLLACGLRKGDRVAIYSPNCYEWPLALLAASKAGLLLVTINYASEAVEVEHCLQKAGCKAIISYDKMKHLDYYDVLNKLIPDLRKTDGMNIQSKKLPSLKCVIMLSEKPKEGVIRFKDVMNMGNEESDTMLSENEKLIQFDDILNVQFTSGTTGPPKAAILTHHGIVNNAIGFIERLGYNKIEKAPIICCQVPFFHTFGLVVGSIINICSKSTTVLPSLTFDAMESLKVIEKYKCTTVLGTPTMFIDLFKSHKTLKNDISSFSQVVVGGASIPENILKALHSDYNIKKIHRGYGLTETSAVVSLMDAETDFNYVFSGFMEPFTGIEVKIIDNHGFIVPKLVLGEICVRGYCVFPGYWEDKGKTSEAIDENGWLHTGDIGVMNDEGWLKIEGRCKDIVIRGGENINVPEVENFLSNHPDLWEVHICGVPDERLGEELCCWISVKPGVSLTEEDIRNFCKGKLSYFKIPRYIMFVEEFPKTTSGKVKKYEMARISREKLNL